MLGTGVKTPHLKVSLLLICMYVQLQNVLALISHHADRTQGVFFISL